MPQSFSSRSEASRRGWETRKSNPYYYSDEAKQKRSEASRKSAETRRLKREKDEPIDQTDVVMETLNEITGMLDGYEPPSNISDTLQGIKKNDVKTLKETIKGAIQRDGIETVAKRCEANANEILDLVNDILYASGSKSNDVGREGFQRKVNEFARIVNGGALTIDESASLTEISEEAEEPEDAE